MGMGTIFANPPRVDRALCDMSKVYRALRGYPKNVRWPSFTVVAPLAEDDALTVRFSLGQHNTRGAVAILLSDMGGTLGGLRNKWKPVAEFDADGWLTPTPWLSKADHTLRAAVWHAVQVAMRDPLEAIAASGRLSGTCQICGRALSDAKSVAAGMGPVCGGRVRRALGQELQEGTGQLLNLDDIEL